MNVVEWVASGEFLSWLLASDEVRYANAALSLLVVALFVGTFYAQWRSLHIRIKRVAPWIVLTYGIIAYGSVEVARASYDVPPGLRVGMLMFNLVGLVITLLYNLGESRRGDLSPTRGLRDDLRILLGRRRTHA